jgi:hypothetical protein
MRNKEVIMAGAIIGIVLLFGAVMLAPTTGNTVQDAVNESTAISDASVNGWSVTVTIDQNAQQNDEWCTSTYNPATKTTDTTCYDDYKDVTVTHITVEQKTEAFFQPNEQVAERTVTNGETTQVSLPREKGLYIINIHSEQGESNIRITLNESGEVADTGWSNEV